MIFYFTGTGNSLWAARGIGEKLNQSVENIMKYKDEKKISCDDDVIGFVFPTYMGDLPWIAKEFLMKLTVKSDCYAFAVMTSNNGKSGVSFKSLDQALALSGAHLSACFDLQMPGNCLISSEKQNQDRLQKAPKRLDNIILSIQDRKKNFTSDGKLPKEDYVTSSYFYGEHSIKRLTLMKNFAVTKNCNGCGLCADVCPVNNIRIADGRAIHGHNCAACYACLHWCPKNATLLKVPGLKHRPQYHHPKVTLADISRYSIR